ncbi:MAG: hypothetical protein ACE15F_12395 [bacterium]
MKRTIGIAWLLSVCVMGSPAQNLGDVITITNAAGAQQFPDVAYNSNDNTFLVVWESVVDINLNDIAGILVNGGTGQPIGNPVVLMTGNDSFEAPEVAYNSQANEFLLVARRVNDTMAVAQRVSAQGQPVGDMVEIGRSGGPTLFDPAARARVVSVAYNATDNRYIIGLGEPMTAQILLPDLSLDYLVENVGIGTNPAVAWSKVRNAYLVAWEDRENRITGSENLSAQLISNIGELIGENIRLRDQEFAEESPRIAYNPDDDQFLVVWDERIGFSDNVNPKTLTDTLGWIIGSSGQMAGNPIPIEAGTAYTLRQDVDYNPQSKLYLVVWKGDPSGDFAFADIYGQFVKRDGTLANGNFLIYEGGDDNTDEGNDERYYDESKLPVVAANPQTGGFYVVWEEGGTNRNPEDRNIMARYVEPTITGLQDWALFE